MAEKPPMAAVHNTHAVRDTRAVHDTDAAHATSDHPRALALRAGLALFEQLQRGSDPAPDPAVTPADNNRKETDAP
ncbi:hypothetical protein ACFVRD_00135 [Streptomyces sp. NPDC057908]|uniref:hypothetical protein n=1 Tax=Streptomyces sp. NPDC057908 TaxID=3346276 RepID=UPI0036EA025C